MKKQENGAVVARQDEKHLYIAFGQSNMQGPGAIRESDTQNINGRWQTLNVVAGTYASVNRVKGRWYKAAPPIVIPDGDLTNYLGLSTGLGPSDHFGRIMTAGTPEKIIIGVAAVANGDLALSSFRKTLGAAYFAAGQGESGGGLEDKTWAEMLKEIYDDISADIGLAANSIPIICGQLFGGGQVAVSIGNDGGAALENMLNTDNRIQNTIPNAWVVSSEGCEGRTGNQQPDGIHFGSEGLQLLGERYGQKMLKLVYEDTE
jgi:hypothetical protein